MQVGNCKSAKKKITKKLTVKNVINDQKYNTPKF